MSTTELERAPTPRRTSGRVHLGAAAFFTVLIAVFLGPALIHGSTVYSPADLTKLRPIQSVGPADYVIKNQLQSDPPTQNVPWAIYDREEIRQGHLPTWNPYNAGGVPELGDDQAGVFSPYSVPYDILPLRLAFVVVAVLKLFALAFGTWAFLRRRGLSVGAAIVGGTAFAFAGYQIFWLNWAHIGSATLLPLCAWAAEVVVQERGLRRRIGIGGIALGLATGLTAGHPETGFYSGLYLLPTLAVTLWGAVGRQRLIAAAAIAGGGVLAVALAAIQMLPFLEYTHLSTTYALRSATTQASGVPLSASGLLGFPDALGNPALNWFQSGYIYQSNYNEGNGDYVGIPVMLLALIGVALLIRRGHRGTAGLGLGISVVGFLSFHITSISLAIEKLPLLNLGSLNRAHEGWDWGTACLAACGVQVLQQTSVLARMRARLGVSVAFAVLAGGMFWLLLHMSFASRAFQKTLPNELIDVNNHIHLWHQHVAAIAVITGMTILLVALGLVMGKRGTRIVPLFLALAVFSATGLLLQGYNPVVQKQYQYPNTPGMKLADGYAGNDPVLRIGDATIFPNTNLPYRTSSVQVIDALGVKWYDDLFASTFGTADPTYFDEGIPTCREQLRLFGIRYVIGTGKVAMKVGTSQGGSTMSGADLADLPRVASTGPFSVFEVPQSTSVATVVGTTVAAADTPTAVAEASNCAFDADASAVMLTSGKGATHQAVGPVGGGGSAIETELAPGRVRLTTAGGGGELIVRRTWFPGWEATVDGASVPVDRADAAFMGLRVPAGTHHVELLYRPRSIRVGAEISVLGLVGFASLFAVPYGLERRRRVRPSMPVSDAADASGAGGTD